MVAELKEAITASGQTLTQIAGASGVDISQLSRFVRGQRDLTFGAVEKICRALNLHLVKFPDRPRAADAGRGVTCPTARLPPVAPVGPRVAADRLPPPAWREPVLSGLDHVAAPVRRRAPEGDDEQVVGRLPAGDVPPVSAWPETSAAGGGPEPLRPEPMSSPRPRGSTSCAPGVVTGIRQGKPGLLHLHPDKLRPVGPASGPPTSRPARGAARRSPGRPRRPAAVRPRSSRRPPARQRVRALHTPTGARRCSARCCRGKEKRLCAGGPARRVIPRWFSGCSTLAA